MNVVAYAYDADIHCPGCTRTRFPGGNLDAHHEDADCPHDGEGNAVGPVFDDGDIPDAGIYCGDCCEEIIEAPNSIQ